MREGSRDVTKSEDNFPLKVPATIRESMDRGHRGSYTFHRWD